MLAIGQLLLQTPVSQFLETRQSALGGLQGWMLSNFCPKWSIEFEADLPGDRPGRTGRGPSSKGLLWCGA
jgi:hypothetical protein